MPMSIPPGLRREHVLLALADLDKGVPHPFGAPTGYELFHEGRSYPPKAVIGLAFRHLRGSILPPEAFSGGNSAGQANYVLRQLGFTVVRMAEDWTWPEVQAIVRDYFEMLESELLCLPYNKTTHRQALAPLLPTRSKGSIEFKHQNVSAALLDMGLPYMDGYKPRANYQALLAKAVQEYLDARPDFFQHLADGPRLNPTALPLLHQPANQLFVPPPDQIIVPREPAEPWLSRRGRKIDFARRDAENRRLGALGEEWVLGVEKRRLQERGRDDLAGKVEWVAKTAGDGLGFDILSFDETSAAERFIEVKTTANPKYFPFLVTANEVRCSQAVRERYHLYRVFNFSTAARLYVLPGSLSENCSLDPVVYRARFQAAHADLDAGIT